MSESGAHDAGTDTTPAWQRDTSAFVPLEQAAIDALNIEYTGIATDSRKVKPGDLFIAYAGELADGRAYIPQALVAGAVAVLWEASEFTWNPDWKVPNLPVANLRYQVGHIADNFFGQPSRHLWIAGITGTNGKTSCAQWIAQSLTGLGRQCAVIGTLGSGLVGESAAKQAPVNTTPDAVSLQATLAGMKVQGAHAVAVEVSSHGIEQGRVNGVAFDVALFTNLTRDHLDYHGEMDSYFTAKRRLFAELVESRGTAVLNADDELVLAMADYTEAEHVCYVTMNPGHQLVREHIRAGGRAVVLEEGMNGHMITIYDGGSHIPLLWTHLIPATLQGKALHNVQNAMFAVALAHGLDIDMENIRHGLRTFDTTFFQAPGRMNIYNEHPFKVILDYAHNTAAVRAICQVVERLGADGQKRIVLSAPGDRRDEDIAEIARILAGKFDHYICRRDDNGRGRGATEVPDMMRRVLLENGVPEDQVEVVADEQDANLAALESAAAGDLLLILGDNVKRTWKQIIYFNAGEREEAGKEQPPPAVALTPEDADAFRLDADMELVRDERGVRIAREAED